MILAIILIAIYLLSSYLMWNYFRIAYSKGGIWENSTPDGEILLFTFIPILNTLCFIIFRVMGNPDKSKQITVTKFFNIKK